MAIQDYRNTPTQGLDASPAPRLMNRRTKTLLLTARSLLQPRVMYTERDTKLLRKCQTETANYYHGGARTPNRAVRRRRRSHETILLTNVGDKEWRKATVSSRLDERSYMVETPERDTPP